MQQDRAYAYYVTASEVNSDDLHVVVPLQGALRGYNQVIQMLDIVWLRNAPGRYRDRLTSST
jgi:hypothetical protein